MYKWSSDYAGSTWGPTIVQNMTNAGWTISQSSPCGFGDYRDSYPEPLLWLAPSCGALMLNFADVDCSGAISSDDSLKVQRYVVFLNQAQSEPCPDIGPAVKINGLQCRWSESLSGLTVL